jgi:hypothetical protein
MDAALDNILDILDNGRTETDLAIAEVLNVQPPEVNIPIEPIFIEAYPFNSDSNVANIDVREAFAAETIYRETELFTRPVPTTITIEGFISNLDFHEQELIEKIEPDQEIVRMKCNYGDKIYEGYQPPLPPKKSNRGRKKNPAKERKRRKQGTGECFNSQMTFVMPSTYTRVIGGVVPSDADVYKFKVFRLSLIHI